MMKKRFSPHVRLVLEDQENKDPGGSLTLHFLTVTFIHPVKDTGVKNTMFHSPMLPFKEMLLVSVSVFVMM